MQSPRQLLLLVWITVLSQTDLAFEVPVEYDRQTLLKELKTKIRDELKEEIKSGFIDCEMKLNTREEFINELETFKRELKNEFKQKWDNLVTWLTEHTKQINVIVERQDKMKLEDTDEGVSNTETLLQTNKVKLRTSDRNIIRNIRLLETSDGGSHVAFYELTKDVPEVGHQQTIIFDEVTTNVGNGYNGYSGVFTVPVAGTYVFSWTTQNIDRTHMKSELVVNSEVRGRAWSDAFDHSDIASGSNTVVLVLENGDAVWIRTDKYHDNYVMTLQGFLGSSFSGWRLF